MRAGNLFSNRGSAVLDAPETARAPQKRSAGLKRSAPVTEMPLRRDASRDDYDRYDDAPDQSQRARGGVRISFREGLIPRTLWGRIAAGCALVVVSGAAIASALMIRSFLLHDARFVVPAPEAIELAGAGHFTHAQLLSIFGQDVGRNVFTIPLNERRIELERLPWVEHATVMRLLPDHLRVAIVERTPVAFVRQGTHIGLVDASGALFDMPSPEMIAAAGGTAPHYSFPVLTGMSAADPLSTRAARMKIYMAFVAALDATGEKISSKLSEVDLSDPEDLRAVIPDAGGSDVLVHFGEDHFLDRYHAYRQHLAEWRAQYPHLTSVDMRYDHQVVLGMKPEAAVASHPAAATTVATAPVANTAVPANKPAAQPGSASLSNISPKAPAHMVTAKTVPHPVRPARAKARPRKAASVHAHSSASAAVSAHHAASGVTQ
ncbi:MAG TPA: FtsQ-type POTRA domain-containing protein [Acidobacteriaceae bacterium]|nr:FtsQ-type POTRA domain-containing protein [Acidobacteriaceae bacterium]